MERPSTRTGHPALHPVKLLVADDEHLVARGLTMNLRDLGYQVIGPAVDGVQAIALCESERPDLAILDIRMPKRNGLAAARIIFRRLGIPVVILSAYSDPYYVTNGNQAGVFGYLLKPVTPDQIRVGISVAWGRFLDSLQQQSEIDDLKQRLENRKIIEQAKWLLVKRKGIAEPEAMRLLQRQARSNQRTVVDVARSVLEHEHLFRDEPD